mgnify:CR=1 FL=1
MSSLRTELARVRLEVAEMAALHPRAHPSIRRILDAVAEAWCVSPADVLSDRQHARLVVPRHAVMALARQLTPHSQAAIGRMLRRDHTTVMHGVAQHARRCAEDPTLAARCAAIAHHLTQEIENGEDQARG